MDIFCGKKAMQAKEARGRNFFSLVLTMSCYRQTCTQTITGRNLKYLRALEILQNEEYLQASGLDDIIDNLYNGLMRNFHVQLGELSDEESGEEGVQKHKRRRKRSTYKSTAVHQSPALNLHSGGSFFYQWNMIRFNPDVSVPNPTPTLASTIGFWLAVAASTLVLSSFHSIRPGQVPLGVAKPGSRSGGKVPLSLVVHIGNYA